MKKLFFMFVAMASLLVSSCTSEAPLQGDEPQVPESSAIRTEAEAIQIAERYIAVLNPSRGTANVKSIERIYSTFSRSCSTPIIYAVNYDNNMGFALISASKEGQDILGYAENGSFDQKTAEQSNSFSFYLDAAKNYVENNLSNAFQTGLTPEKNPDSSWVISRNYTGPYVKVSWGQADDESGETGACWDSMGGIKQCRNLHFRAGRQD